MSEKRLLEIETQTINRRSYPSDLTDAEWAIIEPLVPETKLGGRPSKWSRRELLDAMLYVSHTGSPWRMLPHDFPPWPSAYHYFRLWRSSGVMECINTRLRENRYRKRRKYALSEGLSVSVEEASR